MTLEELKEEAKKQGYCLTPLKTHIELSPCVCGNNHPTQWYGNASGYFYQCDRCHRISIGAKTRDQAKRNWNDLIKEVVSNG